MTVPSPGLHPDVDEDEYHADTTHLSASAAKILLGKRPPSPSWVLAFGSLVHMLLLEPGRFEQTYVTADPAVIGVKADGSRADNPTATMAWKRAVEEVEASGLRVTSPDDHRRAQDMVAAVMAHPTARRLVELSTDREISAYGVNSESGAPVRGRFDLLGDGFIADLKTIGDASPEGFRKSLTGFGYHLSAANYLDLANQHGLDADVFAFINVEREPTPGGQHRVSVCQLTQEALQKGSDDMAKACQVWLDNGKKVYLPDYGDGFHTVDLLPWAYRDNDQDYEELGATA